MKKKTQESTLGTPIDVSEGIPDRAAKPAAKRLVWILAVYALWMSILIYFVVAGGGTGL
jgi:hypothetical protein